MPQEDVFGARSSEPRKAQKGCCGFFAKKKPKFQQTLVILRHSERADYVDPNWVSTEEGKKWRHDAPLTDRGHQLASEVARELAELHKEVNFTAIASSPYRRCLETAACVAHALKLPVVLDQEIGEIWDKNMPQEPRPFRSNLELVEMAKSLKLKLLNPTLEDGGVKLFGKPPKYPESLDSAKARYIVRIETYINQSAATERNFVVVTHADAVVAALQMFERGNAEVEDIDFCARLIAKRTVTPQQEDAQQPVFADHWKIECRALKENIMKPDAKMEKYYEKLHIENVEEKEALAVQRKAARTKTDAMFSESLRKFAAESDEEDDEDEEDATKGGTRA
mmetsp:Transcript_158400/g.279538  ORF Transcript_158400/g.279538 Transcript_158400/m.279538 type:complete len:338 (+) Transcript_158400:155-1168(+)